MQLAALFGTTLLAVSVCTGLMMVVLKLVRYKGESHSSPPAGCSCGTHCDQHCGLLPAD